MHRKRTGRALTAIAAVVIALATLTPSSQAPTRDSFCLICGELGGVDLVLNVLLFVPLGVGMGVARMRWWTVLVIVLACTTSIELLQLTIVNGRDASFGDIVANATGGMLGFALGAHIDTLLLSSPRQAARLALAWLALWDAGQAVACYALQAAPTESRYYGQLSRALGGEPGYPGRVLVAKAGGQDIPDWEVGNARLMASAMRSREGAAVVVVVASTGTPSTPRSIVRVADENEEELLMVGRDGSRATFGVRTRASALRLRPPYFSLDSAFLAAPARPDTVLLRAAYRPAGVTLTAEREGAVLSRHVRLTPWSTWRMLALSNQYYDGSRSGEALDLLFLALCLIPGGYWLAWARRSADGAGLRVRLSAAAPFALLAVGLFLVPRAFGVDGPNALEMAAALSGLMIGGVMATIVAALGRK